MIAESAAVLGHATIARPALAALEPFIARQAVLNVFGGGGFCWGSLAHQVGLLRATLGDLEGARAALDDALRTHERIGAELFAERSREALGTVRS